MWGRHLRKTTILATLVLTIVGCSGNQIAFRSGDDQPFDLGNPDPPCPVLPCDDGNPDTQGGHDTFFQTTKDGRVDILFVDDNSGSMSKEQAEMGSRFNSFITGIGNLDWQIAVTTTDVSSGPWGIDGAILELTGRPGEKIITPATPNADNVFKNTVKRPETLNCQPQNCPSGSEQPLFASIRAVDKRNNENDGFFRNGADLAIVILSDEDEMSTGPNNSTKAQHVIDKVQATWGPEKKMSVYGIIIEPGDQDCLNEQLAQQGNTAHYGNVIADLVQKSGGISGSICDDDYSDTLEEIGKTVRDLIDSYELSQIPIPESLQIQLDPAQPNVSWTLSGNKIKFDPAPQAGTRIDVYYQYSR